MEFVWSQQHENKPELRELINKILKVEAYDRAMFGIQEQTTARQRYLGAQSPIYGKHWQMEANSNRTDTSDVQHKAMYNTLGIS